MDGAGQPVGDMSQRAGRDPGGRPDAGREEPPEPGNQPDAGREEPTGPDDGLGEPLPLLPGFREIALRRMAERRRQLVAELATQRQAAQLSQTEVAARMGTSQSAVARLESGEGDARASTLERYAAAIGRQITWELRGSGAAAAREEARGDDRTDG
jgi:predicted XRE-type DNA-binding protein